MIDRTTTVLPRGFFRSSSRKRLFHLLHPARPYAEEEEKSELTTPRHWRCNACQAGPYPSPLSLVSLQKTNKTRFTRDGRALSFFLKFPVPLGRLTTAVVVFVSLVTATDCHCRKYVLTYRDCIALALQDEGTQPGPEHVIIISLKKNQKIKNK